MSTGLIQRAYLVPGLPHLLAAIQADAWDTLRQALRRVGQQIRALNPELIALYSTQWLSVLGHSFQARPHLAGVHVDENWYEFGEIPFHLRVDTEVALRAAQIASSLGLATKTVNYEGFPLDTGTLVTLRFLNPEDTIPAVIVSCNIYAGQRDSLTLGHAVRQAIEESGKRAVVVACTLLSARFFTEDIDPQADRISRPEDDAWNRRILSLIAQGKNAEVLTLSEEYARAAAVDMGFKA
ncbi:MAG: 2-amino-5-chlorophenol 1,6-dioxygenase subunit alpha, partial [Candidatus Binatia bacterium]|nr:2-amino-5-chlorophenol 1,6-dioxygenase subunit alpha [Candidatus Binatia bacterium]